MSEDKKPEEEAKKELTTADKLKALLDEFDNAPDVAAIEKMKAQHGDIFVSALSDDEVFVFRALSRKEHRKLNADIAEGKISPDAFEDEVVRMCVLWKSIPDLEAKGGTIPSLLEQVMQNSNFLSPQLLSQLVTKL